MFDDLTQEKASSALAYCRARGQKLVTAESCTGGLIAASLTSIAGASDVFERGFVAYSNEAKSELLDVDPALIEAQGAVSGAVACAMAEGALKNSLGDIVVSCTGIAGPDGGSDEKPVGTVHIAKAQKTLSGVETVHEAYAFDTNDRHLIQQLTVKMALALILSGPDDGMIA